MQGTPSEDFSFSFLCSLMAFKLDRMWSVAPSPHKIATVCVGPLIYLSLILRSVWSCLDNYFVRAGFSGYM